MEPVRKPGHNRLLLGRVMVAMVVVLEAVPKPGHSRLLLDRVTVAMVNMEQPDRPRRLVLNQLPLDKAMVMVTQVVPKPDPNHKARVHLPLDMVVNGQNIASREMGSVYE